MNLTPTNTPDQQTLDGTTETMPSLPLTPLEQVKVTIMAALTGLGIKARTQKPPTYPDRKVTADLVSYDDPRYDPVYFADPKIYGDPSKLPKYAVPLPTNEAELISYLNSLPRNPLGPTGIFGPAKLGKPENWAADPIVFTIDPASGDIYQLQILRDNDEWGIPGGMVDDSEAHLSAALRELEEETGVMLSGLSPVKLYQGPVDDYRNTDTHWIASSVFLYMVPWEEAKSFNLHAQDEAEIKDIALRRLDPDNLASLFASHTNLVKLALVEVGMNVKSYVADSELQSRVLNSVMKLLGIAEQAENISA